MRPLQALLVGASAVAALAVGLGARPAADPRDRSSEDLQQALNVRVSPPAPAEQDPG